MRRLWKIYKGLFIYGMSAGMVLGLMKFVNTAKLADLFVWGPLFGVLLFAAAVISVKLIPRDTEIKAPMSEEPSDEDLTEMRMSVSESSLAEDWSWDDDAKPTVVRIKPCDFPFAWYYDRQGEIFEVVEHDEDLYITKGRKPEGYIRKEDCELI